MLKKKNNPEKATIKQLIDDKLMKLLYQTITEQQSFPAPKKEQIDIINMKIKNLKLAREILYMDKLKVYRRP